MRHDDVTVPAEPASMADTLAASAFDLYSQRGIARVRLDEIAAAAGVTKGSLYWHYRSKDEIVLAACGHYYRSWHEQMAREIKRARSPSAKLKRAVRASVRTCLIDEANRTFTLELFTLSLHDADVRSGWRAFFDSVRIFYVDLLTDAIASGEAESRDAEAAVDLMLAAMEGYKLRALFEPSLCAPSAERRICAALLDQVGLAA